MRTRLIQPLSWPFEYDSYSSRSLGNPRVRRTQRAMARNRGSTLSSACCCSFIIESRYRWDSSGFLRKFSKAPRQQQHVRDQYAWTLFQKTDEDSLDVAISDRILLEK